MNDTRPLPPYGGDAPEQMLQAIRSFPFTTFRVRMTKALVLNAY
ncbi:MAG: hypothetical protein WCA51_00810 [Dehalococcoidia bacterium]